MRRFLSSVFCCLSASVEFEESGEGRDPACLHLVFRTNQLKDSCAPLLLFLIGQLASCAAGASLLKSMGFSNLLFRLTLGLNSAALVSALEHRSREAQKALNQHRLICFKLLIGSIDFTRPGLGRSLLSVAVLEGSIVSTNKSCFIFLGHQPMLMFSR